MASLPKKHTRIKSPKMRLFRLKESGRVALGREGVKEMSIDTIGSHPTFICPDPWVHPLPARDGPWPGDG